MKTPAAGPKTKRGAPAVGGALTIILGWIVTDVIGYPMPDHVLQSWTLVIMYVLNEWSKDDETPAGFTPGAGSDGVRQS